jgi:hypothetical protein
MAEKQTTGMGYASVYTQARAGAAEAALESAREELLSEAKADASYRTELLKRIKDIDIQIMAHQKALVDLEKTKLTAASRGRTSNQGVEDDALRAKIDIFRIQQGSADKAADRRSKAIARVARDFEVPGALVGATQRLNEEVAAAVRANSANPTRAVSEVMNSISLSEPLAAAVADATEVQRAQAASAMFESSVKNMAERGVVPNVSALSSLKASISQKFQVEPTLMNAEVVQQKRSEAEKEAVKSVGAARLAAPDVDTELGLEIIPPKPEDKVEEQDPIRAALTQALLNDGVITPAEEAAFAQANPEAGVTLEESLTQNADDLFLQRVASVGSLRAKKLGLEGSLEEIGLPTVPSTEDIRARAGQILSTTLPERPGLKGPRPAKRSKQAKEFAEAWKQMTDSQKEIMRAQVKAQQVLNKNNNELPGEPSGPEANVYTAAMLQAQDIAAGEIGTSGLEDTAKAAIIDAIGSKASVEEQQKMRQKFYEHLMTHLLHGHRANSFTRGTVETEEPTIETK